jgi:hypothetical protein
MRRAADALSARLLPKGWLDLGRQILLFVGAYYLYSLVRGLADGRAQTAFEHARQLVHLERSLGIFTEPAINAWTTSVDWLADIASWMYVNSHFTITTATLVFIYLQRNQSFYFVRNMFMIAMGIALVLYVTYPTAPPRFMPELGFTDNVANITGVEPDSGLSSLLFNPYAAVPSMHVAFACMLGLPMRAMVTRLWARLAWSTYPLVVTLVVVSTANHWWFDAVAGALTAALAAVGARYLAVLRPHAWALRPSGAVTA